MKGPVVDLTLDSDSDEGPSRPPPPKRQRTAIKPEPIVVDSDDLEVEIVEKPAAAAAAAPAADADSDEELVITGDVGLVSGPRHLHSPPSSGAPPAPRSPRPAPQIANRDLPHLRHDRAVHKFAPGNAATNAQRCEQVRRPRPRAVLAAGAGRPAARAQPSLWAASR
jgi:hypothetical protein